MMYVFTLIKQPDPNLVQFVQDAVRHHLVKLVIAAKLQSTRSSSRSSSKPLISSSSNPPPIQVDDLLFVLRDDASKVERLKSYLGWKDVRKKTRAEPTGPSATTADEDEIDGIEEPDKNLKVVGKSRINLKWELGDPWLEYLVAVESSSSSSDSSSVPSPIGSPSLSATATAASSSSSSSFDKSFSTTSSMLSVEEKRAFETNREILRVCDPLFFTSLEGWLASLCDMVDRMRIPSLSLSRRVRGTLASKQEANELTKRMTREEYEHYATARQASFVYRKSESSPPPLLSSTLSDVCSIIDS